MGKKTKRPQEILADINIDPEKLKGQAEDVSAALAAAAHKAGEAAVKAKDWAAPHVVEAKDWITPRAQHAWQQGLEKAAPKVQQAALKAAPVVEQAHDKLVDDLLPKVVESINRAAAAGIAATASGVERLADASAKAPQAVADLASTHVPAAAVKRRSKMKWVLAGLAAGGAAIILYRKAQTPSTDPWAEPWPATTSDEPTSAGLKQSEEPAPAAASKDAVKSEAASGSTSAASAAASKTTASKAPASKPVATKEPAKPATKPASGSAAKASGAAASGQKKPASAKPAATPKPAAKKPAAKSSAGDKPTSSDAARGDA